MVNAMMFSGQDDVIVLKKLNVKRQPKVSV